jgi:hypothetical protein
MGGNEHVDAARAQVEGHAPGSAAWANAMAALAGAILEDADPEASDATAQLSQAIDVRRAALARLDPDLDATVGVHLRNDLAVDLSSRYRCNGHLPDLIEACELGRLVLGAAENQGRDEQADHDWVAPADNLAARLSMLARHPGHAHELDEAVRLATAAPARPPAHGAVRNVAIGTSAGVAVHRWQQPRTNPAPREKEHPGRPRRRPARDGARRARRRHARSTPVGLPPLRHCRTTQHRLG